MGYHDMARMYVSGTPGTGPITLRTFVPGYQTFAASGVVNGELLSYGIDNGDGQWEVGRAAYSAAGPTLARGTIYSSNNGLAISVGSLAQVWCTILADDVASVSMVEGMIAAQNLPPVPPYSPPIHQNLGGESTGNTLVRANQNATITPCDHFQIEAPNPGVVAATVTGTPASGQQVGIRLTLNSILYTVLYTVQPADVTLIEVMLGLQACIGNDTTAPHCTVTPSSLTNALLVLGYRTAAGNAQLGAINFNVPIPQATNLVGVSSGSMTVTTFPNGSLSNVQLDNGPYFATITDNPGRTPLAGDHLGFFGIFGQSTTGLVDAQYGSVAADIVDPTAGAVRGALLLKATNGLGNPGTLPVLALSRGDYSDDGGGVGTLLADPGSGRANRIGYHLTAKVAPAAPPSGQSVLYMDIADGRVKIKKSDGSVTPLN